MDGFSDHPEVHTADKLSDVIIGKCLWFILHFDVLFYKQDVGVFCVVLQCVTCTCIYCFQYKNICKSGIGRENEWHRTFLVYLDLVESMFYETEQALLFIRSVMNL